MIEGGCHRCGLSTQIIFESNNPPVDTKLVCSDCYERYYSPEAIRQKKLNQVLYKSIWSKLKSLFKI